MTFAEVKYLTEKGFSHDEIISIMNGSPITAPVPEPVPAAPAAPAAPEPAPAPVPEPVPVPAVVAPEPVPAAPSTAGQDSNAAVMQLSQDVRNLIQTIQAGNIINSRNAIPKEYTAEMAMAEILNPRTNEPIGGKEK